MRKRVRLAPAKVGDAAPLAKAIRVEAIQNFTRFAGKTKQTVATERAYLREKLSSGTDLIFLVFHCHSGRLLGTVGLHEIDWHNHTARIGEIIFHPRDRGHHYGSEAMLAVMRLGFTELGLNKIYANVLTTSEGNIAREEKLGFRKEAVLKEAYLLRGEYLDMVHMTITRKRWLSRYSAQP